MRRQAKCLVNRVVTQSLCHYRNLRYSRHEDPELPGADPVAEGEPPGRCWDGWSREGSPRGAAIPAGSLPCVVLLPGNLPLLPPAPLEVPPCPKLGLVSQGGTVLNVGKLLEKAEQAESSRLYLEGKIHALEAKLGESRFAWGDPAPRASSCPVLTGAVCPPEESQLRVAATVASNRALVTKLQDLQRRLDEAEERAREAGRQKLRLGRLLQESRKRLAPLQLELQAIIEKVRSASPLIPEQQHPQTMLIALFLQTSTCLEEEPASSS